VSGRVLLFCLVAGVCAAIGITSVAGAVRTAHRSRPPAGVQVHGGGASVGTGATAQLLFRNTIDDKTFGKIAVAPLGNADTDRAIAGLSCDRVYFSGGRGLCLRATAAFGSSYEAQIFDSSFRVRRTLDLQGIPSRARVSADGRLGALTTFVNGDSYDPGNFSTRTEIVDLQTGRVLAQLEQFSVTKDGRPFHDANFNFWGVTFAHDDDHFYATLGSGANTYLVEGSIRAKTFRVLTTHLECPSLSPDGTRIAFKQSLNSHGEWRLYVLDLTTMRRWPLSETHSVDDQAEWLDDTRVLYWRAGDIWVARADGQGTPAVFVRDASSPAVVSAG
jgi:hypothetical protein